MEIRSRDKLNSKSPHSLQGSPLEQGVTSTGDSQGQCQPGKSPGHSPAPGWGCSSVSPQTPGGSSTPGQRVACSHTASSNAHLARAALLPALLLTRFQHLKEAQESPELNGRQVLELGQPAEVEKRLSRGAGR